VHMDIDKKGFQGLGINFDVHMDIDKKGLRV